MKKIIIIAEAGINHNGNMELAYRLIDAAKEAGADYIKFQTWKSESIISKYAAKATYQKETTNPAESMLEMVKKLEFPFENFLLLKEYSLKTGIGFLSSPFDIESVRYLASIGLDMIKIPSGEVTNLPYLESVREYAWKIILSTGMCEFEDIETAVEILQEKEKKDITVLQCNTQYPTPVCDVNLRAMGTLKNYLELAVGLSDHTMGIEVPIAAAALGAEIIEKHLTLSRLMEGPDHKASLEPQEFKEMVRGIRTVEAALGSRYKRVTESEKENAAAARKSIVAARKIHAGEAFTVENLAVKRPGTGISPMKWYEVLGRTAQKDFEEDEPIIGEF